MKEDKIKILILNYNGEKLLKECLDSVQSIDYSNYSTILIDNGSSDKSIDYVKSLYGDSVEIVGCRSGGGSIINWFHHV